MSDINKELGQKPKFPIAHYLKCERWSGVLLSVRPSFFMSVNTKKGEK